MKNAATANIEICHNLNHVLKKAKKLQNKDDQK